MVKTTGPSIGGGRKYISLNSDYKRKTESLFLSLRITRLGMQSALKVGKAVVLLLLMKK
jgi:hypothetical protein